MTRDQTSDHRTITLEKFVKRVASAVGRFFDVSFFSSGYGPLLFSSPTFRLVTGSRGT